MSKGTRSALLIAAVTCLSVAVVQSAIECEKHKLDEIEQHLRDTVYSHDIKENIEGLEKYAKELKKTFNPSRLINRGSQLEIIRNMILAAGFLEEPECNRQEFELLNSLDVLIHGIAFVTRGKVGPCLHRFTTVFNSILKSHINQCWERHADGVLKADENVSDVARQTANLLLDSLLEYYHMPKLTVATVITILRRTYFSGVFDLKTVRRILRKSTDETTISVIREGGRDAVKVVGRILDEHLLNGCKQYVDSTGDAAQAASLNLVLYNRDFQDWTNCHRIIGASHLCKIALDNRELLAKDLAKLL